MLTTLTGATLAALYVAAPRGALMFNELGNVLGPGIFIGAGFFISYLAGRLNKSGKHENALRLLVQQTLYSIGDAVISTDTDKHVRLMNRVAEQLTGWTEEEARGKPITEVFRIVREGSDIPAENPVDRILRTGTVVGPANHIELIKKTGERFPIDDSGSPVRDQHGEIAGAVLVFRDITTRRRAELDLADSERRSREILESIDDAFVLLDQQWRLAKVNPAAEKLLMTPAEALLGKAYWQLQPASVGTQVEALCKKAVADGVPVRLDYYHAPRRKWFDIGAYPSNSGLALYFRDVTARKRLERHDALLVELDDAVRPLTDAREITQTAARLLGEYLDVSRCAYADVEKDEDTFNLTGDYNRGVPSIVGRYTFAQFGADCLRLMREGQPYIVEDSETDHRTDPVRESYRLTLIRSVICVSLLKQGRFVAAMAVHQNTPRKWEQDEVELTQVVASRCWESIERTRVSRELQEREQRYRFLAESIPQMVWTATPEGKLDYVNEQVTRYFGVPSETMFGEGWLRWVHPDDLNRTVERWSHSIKTGAQYEAAFRLLRSGDNSWRWHLVRARPLLDSSRRVAQWFGTCTDFEDQKQAEAHLRQQWHTFDTALSHTPDFTYIFDLEGRFTYVNRALLSLWQKSFEQARGKNFFELDYPPELAERLQRQIQQVIDVKEVVRDHTPFTAVSGGTREYEYILVPVLAANGKVEAVAGSTRDVTDRRRIERALAASEEQLRRVFRQAPVAIIVLRGREFMVELANPSYEALLPGKELVGRRFGDVVPELGQHVWDAFNSVLDTGQSFVAREWHIPYDADGDGVVEDHWFNVTYNPLRETEGSVDGVIAVLTDVTAQMTARRELERVNRELEEFAYVASHDLQEPLRMVKIYSQLLVKRFAAGGEREQEYANFVQEGVSRMERLIHGLLNYSRIVQKEELPVGTADLSAALTEALSVLKPGIEETGAIVAATPLPVVSGDEMQLAHVFQNLLSNAMKYRSPDVCPRIQISARQDGTRCIISVQDNGIGFEQKYAERIFGLFKRLHKDDYPGTGLGLAICQRIVERYSGRMWAESSPGKGATFYFSLLKADAE